MRTVVVLAVLLAAGCAKQVKVEPLPPVCPAPRETPALTLAEVEKLPEQLPPLANGSSEAMFANRDARVLLYQRARLLARRLAEWITNGPAD